MQPTVFTTGIGFITINSYIQALPSASSFLKYIQLGTLDKSAASQKSQKCQGLSHS